MIATAWTWVTALAGAVCVLFPHAGGAQGSPSSPSVKHGKDTVLAKPVQKNPGSPTDLQADSLYLAARAAMAKNDYPTSVRLFNLVARRYPLSAHAASALYLEGFLRYRGDNEPGNPVPLRAALVPLQKLEQKYPKSPQAADGQALQMRICGELAQLGDSVCLKRVFANASPSKIQAATQESTAVPKKVATKPAPKSGRTSDPSGRTVAVDESVIKVGSGIRLLRDTSCHNDKQLDSYVAALSGLWKVDPNKAMMNATEVLMKRDRCLSRLREQTMLMIVQRPAPVLAMTPIIFDVARNDPDSSVKRLATRWLLSQEWEESTAKFLHSIFGQTFRPKTNATGF